MKVACMLDVLNYASVLSSKLYIKPTIDLGTFLGPSLNFIHIFGLL